ncbi:hypothetical protein [Methylocucumis oryzae]
MSEVPSERWNWREFYSAERNVLGRAL